MIEQLTTAQINKNIIISANHPENINNLDNNGCFYDGIWYDYKDLPFKTNWNDLIFVLNCIIQNAPYYDGENNKVLISHVINNDVDAAWYLVGKIATEIINNKKSR